MLRARLRRDSDLAICDPVTSAAARTSIAPDRVVSTGPARIPARGRRDRGTRCRRWTPRPRGRHHAAVGVVRSAGGNRSGRLLVVAHHLVVDGVSWRILVPDLATAWAQLSSAGQPIRRPAGTSMRRWAHGLVESAGERAANSTCGERSTDSTTRCSARRPLDPALDVVATVGRVSGRRCRRGHRRRAHRVPEHPRRRERRTAHRAGARASRLAAQPRTCAAGESALVSLEGHGREEDAVARAPTCPARSAGSPRCSRSGSTCPASTSTTRSPAARPRAPRSRRSRNTARPSRTTASAYGMLRVPQPPTRACGACPLPQISFNYLGRFAAGPPSTAEQVTVAGSGR